MMSEILSSNLFRLVKTWLAEDQFNHGNFFSVAIVWEAPSGTFVAFPGNVSPCSSILKWISFINSSLGENQRKNQLCEQHWLGSVDLYFRLKLMIVYICAELIQVPLFYFEVCRMCFLTFSEFVFTRKRDAHYFFKASAKATEGRQGHLWTFWSGTARACGNCWCCSFPIWAQKSSRSWEKPWQDCE